MLNQCVSFGRQTITNGYKSITLTNNVDVEQSLLIPSNWYARGRKKTGLKMDTQTNLTIKKFHF